MKLAHRIEIKPTVKQQKYFSQACGTARFTWNWALAEWNRQYAAGGKPKATDLKRQFNAIKYERFPWLKGIHRDAHAQPFAQIAWRNFFEDRAEGPKFKKKGKCRDSFYVANDKFRIGANGISLPMVGEVKARERLRFNGEVQGAVVSRKADRSFISVTVETGEPDSDVPPAVPVGFDLGIGVFAKLSTGEDVFAPKPLKKAQAKLRRLNRRLARTQRASKNHSKAAMRLARQHRRVRNVRQDFLDKFTTKLAKNHTEICIEDLNVSGMAKNHSLALHIHDAAWGETRRQLEYKTVLYGSKLTVRDRFYASSKLCSACGWKHELLLLSDRVWTCLSCGTMHDRDHNAAINLVQPIPQAIAGIHASGETGAVRPLGERGTLSYAHIRAQER